MALENCPTFADTLHVGLNGRASGRLSCQAPGGGFLLSNESADYLGDGRWFAILGICGFIVDDKTGKVTGP